MLLNTIVENSNYVTDEELNDLNIVGMANSAIAEINSKCSTNLPLFVQDNVSAIPYKALVGTWALRLVEPYLSYSIAANDDNSNTRDFHYNRFLKAINEFKKHIEDAILEKDPLTGEDTGYIGKGSRKAIMTTKDFGFHWRGW